MSTTKQRWARRAAPFVAAATVLLSPTAAQANIEAGHPELYKNGTEVVAAKPGVVQVGWGNIELRTEAIHGEIECVNLGFGDGWNEGTEKRAYGQILSGNAGGDMPFGSHTVLSSRCRPEGSKAFVTDETWTKAEENGSHEVEVTKRSLSVPWNIESRCGAREEEYVAIVKIGVPNTEFPGASSHCPASTEFTATEEEEAGYLKEKTEKKGCYKTNPSPEGCIRFVFVEPGSGLEWAMGGSLWPKVVVGTKNGLFPSKLKLEENRSGELQCEFPEGCSSGFTYKGEVVVGGSKLELVSLK